MSTSSKSNISCTNDYKTFYNTICQYPEEALPNAYRVKKYVDEIIIVHSQPVLKCVKEEFDSLNATLHFVDWKEDFSFKRTQYIRKSGEIIKEKGKEKGYTKDNVWMIISDTDEFPSISLLQNLQNIITKAELENRSVCKINVHDYMIKGEGTEHPFTFIPRPLEDIGKNEIISQSVGSYYKELLIKYNDRLTYRGKVHHTLSGTGLKMMKALPEYYYDHIKTDADLHSHGCRNWFIGGGGIQEFGQKWKDMHNVTDRYGLDTWEKMEKAMKIGNIYSDILQFIVDHRNDNDSHTDSELRSFYSYYKILHENELKNIVQTVKTVVTKDGIVDAIPEVKVEIPKIDKTEQGSHEINDKLINTSEPLYGCNNTREDTGNYIEDLVYHFQNVKVSSDSSNTPKIVINNDKNKSKDEDKIKNEDDDEIREFVEDTYNRILGRVGDFAGVNNYIKTIKNGQVKKEKLADIFRRSDEYKDKGLDT